MKGQAVPSKDQQRKEAQRKEAAMPTTNQLNEHDQEASQSKRVAIYLSETSRPGSDDSQSELPIKGQRILCRRAATRLEAEIVGEFVDEYLSRPSRPGLHQALDLVEQRQLDYLIVSSLDRLALDVNEAFDISWRLCLAGGVAVPADWEYEFPWTRAKKPSRN
jgi:Resolvase, N terminal domain